MSEAFRPSWQNCCLPDDENLLKDEELAAINAMEDSIAPLEKDAARTRELITGFESCYHEADRQAELIVRAIGTGRPPVESGERPPGRKQQLEDCRDILSAWCQETFDQVRDRDVGNITAEKLAGFLEDRTPLKKWQVRRIIDKVTSALDQSQPYHNMVLNVGDYGEAGDESLEGHYKDNSAFLNKTVETVIHDTVDGQEAEISLALAVDRLTPCNWNFVENLVVLLKAIGSDLNPDECFACCERNILSTPLRDRLRVISSTLGAFWKNEEAEGQMDDRLLVPLGSPTPIKCWLAACLDKTIRLQLDPDNVRRMYEWVAEWLK